MAFPWNELLADHGWRPEAGDFGRPEEELRAASEATICAPLIELGLILATGEEAIAFLHNLLTNDVKSLPPDGVRFAGFCSAKGRLLASLHLWHQQGEMALMLSADLLPAVLKKLSMYVLRSKVQLRDASNEICLFGLSGPQAEALLAALGAATPFPLQTIPFSGGRAVRLDGRRFVLAVEAGQAKEIWHHLSEGARPIGPAVWRWLEIMAGQPRISAATQEMFVPQMVNMELPAVGGVSFTKGCYPGQEIVARAQYLGKVKRRMHLAHIEVEPVAGAAVFTSEAGEQHCGNVVLAAPSPEGGYDCLVVVQSQDGKIGEIHLGAPDGPLLTPNTLPYPLDT